MSQHLATEDIQRLLEENYVFLKAIVDQQNLGRLQQMQEYQAKLQQNLMLLAAVADAHPDGGAQQRGGAQAGQTGGAQPAAAQRPPNAAGPTAGDANNHGAAAAGAPRPGTMQQGQAPTLFLGGGLPPGQANMPQS